MEKFYTEFVSNGALVRNAASDSMQIHGSKTVVKYETSTGLIS